MRILKKLSWTLLASLLAVSIFGVAAAQSDTSEATVEVVPISNDRGVLSVSITNIDFGEHEYRLTDHTTSGSLTIYASDMRGTAGGWTVTLASTDFTSADAPDFPIPIGNLSAPAGSVSHIGCPSGHPTDRVPIAWLARPVTIAPAAIIHAKPGTGAGYYQNHRPHTQLTIPGGTLIGGYQATLTVTITGNNP